MEFIYLIINISSFEHITHLSILFLCECIFVQNLTHSISVAVKNSVSEDQERKQRQNEIIPQDNYDPIAD